MERCLNLGVKGVPALERHHGLEWKCVLDFEWRGVIALKTEEVFEPQGGNAFVTLECEDI
jgi:hypothetical protein